MFTLKTRPHPLTFSCSGSGVPISLTLSAPSYRLEMNAQSREFRQASIIEQVFSLGISCAEVLDTWAVFRIVIWRTFFAGREEYQAQSARDIAAEGRWCPLITHVRTRAIPQPDVMERSGMLPPAAKLNVILCARPTLIPRLPFCPGDYVADVRCTRARAFASRIYRRYNRYFSF